MKNQYLEGDCLKRGREGLDSLLVLGGLVKKEEVVFLRGGGRRVDTPMPTMNISSDLELSRIDLPKLSSSILMEIVTVPVGQVDEFYFYMHYPIKAWLFEKIIFELVYLFHLVLKSLVSY